MRGKVVSSASGSGFTVFVRLTLVAEELKSISREIS
jgi:hypothetical protein